MAEPHSHEGSDTSNSGAAIASPRSSTESRSSSSRNTLRVSQMSTNHQHRQSLSETLRGPPGSPRARRQPSLPQSAIQSLIDNPPPPKSTDPAFVGRDWREISIGELVKPDELRFVELDTGIEDATNVGIQWFSRRLALTPSIPDLDRLRCTGAVDPRVSRRYFCCRDVRLRRLELLSPACGGLDISR
jgi:hypothetical protein